MNRIPSHLIAAAVAAVALSAGAFAAQDDQHQGHHPDAASAPAPAAAPKPAPSPSAVQSQMKAMQAVHEKMMAARTPEERNALMAEHMKTMRDGMATMQGMTGGAAKGDPAARQRMMEMRMDMMQSMMQMIMDGMAAAPSK